MFGFICSAISSHLQTCGCSVVVGSSAEKVNKVMHFLINQTEILIIRSVSGLFGTRFINTLEVKEERILLCGYLTSADLSSSW